MTQYSSIQLYQGSPAAWMPEEDVARIQSYDVYENMYWNEPGTFTQVLRGSNNRPLYIPLARVLVEATNRFLAQGFRFVVHNDAGTPEAQAEVKNALTSLFIRENFYGKFASQKRHALIRGDALWHVTADPTKEAGSRISIHELDPASYFPIYDDDSERLMGVHLIDQIEHEETIVTRRQTYRKVFNDAGVLLGISTELTLFEEGKWDDRDGTADPPVQVASIIPEAMLPPEIRTIPVYMWLNTRIPGSPYGSSELRGLEGPIAAVNQAVTDADLALALEGLGVYSTTSGPPVDDDGNETTWSIAPGKVLELDPDSEFKRITGITSIDPVITHVKFVDDKLNEAVGVPDIAVGRVDTNVAESGIALQLKMSPILSKNKEKEVEILGVHNQMIYDLTRMWLPAYEQINQPEVIVEAKVDNPIPVNREQSVAELISLYEAGIVSLAYVHTKLNELGYDIPSTMVNDIMAEKEQLTTATDPYARRVGEELA